MTEWGGEEDDVPLFLLLSALLAACATLIASTLSGPAVLLLCEFPIGLILAGET
jgi:hypothetical protein